MTCDCTFSRKYKNFDQTNGISLFMGAWTLWCQMTELVNCRFLGRYMLKNFITFWFIHLLPKRNSYTRTFDFYRFFIHVYFFKTWNKIEKNHFGMRAFFPKIANFCHSGLPPAKTYWMIMSPKKRVKKIPNRLYWPNIHILCKLAKTNFEVIFKAHFRAKKISKIIMDP